MSDKNFQTPNEQTKSSSSKQKILKQVVDVTRPGLKKVVDIDYNYLERKEKYEQAKKAGLAVEPPVPSSLYFTRREQIIASLQNHEQKNQPKMKAVPVVIEEESFYNIPFEQLLESDAQKDLHFQIQQSSVQDITIEPHNQLLARTDALLDSGEQKSAQVSLVQKEQFVENRNILPVQNNSVQVSMPYNPNAGIHQNLGITGVIPANANVPIQIGNFIKDNRGYYFQNKEGKWVRFTDFFIVIEYLEIVVDVNGDMTKKFLIRLMNDRCDIKELSVHYEDWINLQSQIEHQAPAFQIFADEYRNVGEKFKRLLGELLKNIRVEEKLVYDYWGWGQSINGCRKFYHGGLPDCKSEKCLPPPVDRQSCFNIFNQAWNIFNIGSYDVTVPIIFYSLASYADAVFTDAGYPLAHCLMIVGESGTLKTSFCKVIFAPFVPEKDRLNTVRATAASLRVLHEKFYDDTLVVDDFNLEGSSQEVKEKMRNIRDLIRAYSDKTPRAKYGGKDNVKKYAIRGGCVFTGETKLTGQLKSSELRYIKVLFKERLNGNMLAVFQKNPCIWQVVVAEFIRHLERNYLAIAAEVKRTFTQERNIQGLESSRLIDTFLHLKIIAKIFCDCCLEVGLLTKENVTSWLNYFTQVLYTVVSSQDKESESKEPYILFLIKFFDMVGTGKLVIAPDIDTYIQDMRHYIGYRDNKNQVLMIKRADSFNVVYNELCRNEYLPISVDDLSKILKREGLTKCDKDGCLKKASSRIEGRPLMLALIESKCKDIVDNAQN